MKTALLAFTAALSLVACANHGEAPVPGAVAYYYGPSARIPTPSTPDPSMYAGTHNPSSYAGLIGADPLNTGRAY